MLVEILLGIFIVTFLVGCYVVWNLMKKAELLEDWVEVFTRRIQRVQDDLAVIDSKGHFEADDEIGVIFDQIKNTDSQLENLKGENVDAS